MTSPTGLTIDFPHINEWSRQSGTGNTMEQYVDNWHGGRHSGVEGHVT